MYYQYSEAFGKLNSALSYTRATLSVFSGFSQINMRIELGLVTLSLELKEMLQLLSELLTLLSSFKSSSHQGPRPFHSIAK